MKNGKLMITLTRAEKNNVCLLYTSIDNIYISRDQRLFIGCDGMGIFVYNPVTGFLQNNPLFSRCLLYTSRCV